MSQYQQDELTQLFARNLSLNQTLPQHSSTPDKQFVNQSSACQPTYYASQHYTPPSYAYAQPSSSPAARADSPLSLPEHNLESMLRQHDIDPAALSPSQAKLFTNADYEQRLRLLELWRISPPEASQGTNHWVETSMAEEEEAARQRFEQRMRWREQKSQITPFETANEEVEPYMTSGYARHRHSDPIYASGTKGLWQSSSTHTMQQMEDSYGAFEQARNFEQLQALNRQVENERGAGDDDMIM